MKIILAVFMFWLPGCHLWDSEGVEDVEKKVRELRKSQSEEALSEDAEKVEENSEEVVEK